MSDDILVNKVANYIKNTNIFKDASQKIDENVLILDLKEDNQENKKNNTELPNKNTGFSKYSIEYENFKKNARIFRDLQNNNLVRNYLRNKENNTVSFETDIKNLYNNIGNLSNSEDIKKFISSFMEANNDIDNKSLKTTIAHQKVNLYNKLSNIQNDFPIDNLNRVVNFAVFDEKTNSIKIDSGNIGVSFNEDNNDKNIRFFNKKINSFIDGQKDKILNVKEININNVNDLVNKLEGFSKQYSIFADNNEKYLEQNDILNENKNKVLDGLDYSKFNMLKNEVKSQEIRSDIEKYLDKFKEIGELRSENLEKIKENKTFSVLRNNFVMDIVKNDVISEEDINTLTEKIKNFNAKTNISDITNIKEQSEKLKEQIEEKIKKINTTKESLNPTYEQIKNNLYSINRGDIEDAVASTNFIKSIIESEIEESNINELENKTKLVNGFNTNINNFSNKYNEIYNTIEIFNKHSKEINKEFSEQIKPKEISNFKIKGKLNLKQIKEIYTNTIEETNKKTKDFVNYRNNIRNEYVKLDNESERLSQNIDNFVISFQNSEDFSFNNLVKLSDSLNNEFNNSNLKELLTKKIESNEIKTTIQLKKQELGEQIFKIGQYNSVIIQFEDKLKKFEDSIINDINNDKIKDKKLLSNIDTSIKSILKIKGNEENKNNAINEISSIIDKMDNEKLNKYREKIQDEIYIIYKRKNTLMDIDILERERLYIEERLKNKDNKKTINNVAIGVNINDLSTSYLSCCSGGIGLSGKTRKISDEERKIINSNESMNSTKIEINQLNKDKSFCGYSFIMSYSKDSDAVDIMSKAREKGFYNILSESNCNIVLFNKDGKVVNDVEILKNFYKATTKNSIEDEKKLEDLIAQQLESLNIDVPQKAEQQPVNEVKVDIISTAATEPTNTVNAIEDVIDNNVHKEPTNTVNEVKVDTISSTEANKPKHKVEALNREEHYSREFAAQSINKYIEEELEKVRKAVIKKLPGCCDMVMDGDYNSTDSIQAPNIGIINNLKNEKNIHI